MKVVINISFPLFVLLSSPIASFGQRWEVGAAASTLFVTTGDAVLGGQEVYARRSLSPRLQATVAVSRFAGQDTARLSLVQEGQWYVRSRVHAEAGLRYAFLRAPTQSLAVHGGPSVRMRQDQRLQRQYYPLAFAGNEDKIALVEAQCARQPGCVSRRYTVHPGESPYPGPAIALAQDESKTSVGGFLELGYHARYRRLGGEAFAGIRAYASDNDSFTWHAGLRLGAAF